VTKLCRRRKKGISLLKHRRRRWRQTDHLKHRRWTKVQAYARMGWKVRSLKRSGKWLKRNARSLRKNAGGLKRSAMVWRRGATLRRRSVMVWRRMVHGGSCQGVLPSGNHSGKVRRESVVRGSGKTCRGSGGDAVPTCGESGLPFRGKNPVREGLQPDGPHGYSRFGDARRNHRRNPFHGKPLGISPPGPP